MAKLGIIQSRGTARSFEEVAEQLRQLEDQIRYALGHLDGSNMQAGAVGLQQLSQDIQRRLLPIGRTESGAAVQIRVGASRPAGRGILWIRPGEADETGLSECDIFYIK